jgi:REP element-mobilizing transposase RayT
VWITKYRCLTGEVVEQAGDRLKQIAAALAVRLAWAAVSPDHIQITVIAPPQRTPARLMQFLKEPSSRTLQQ